MKLLIFDCNTFSYKLDHKTPVAEEVSEDSMENKYEHPMVAFIAIEEKDDESVIPQVAKDVQKLARKNSSKLVVLNPFAHLSSRLAKPGIAIDLLGKLTEELQKCRDFKTVRATFGWYKQFKVDVKGHDSSQIYREY